MQLVVIPRNLKMPSPNGFPGSENLEIHSKKAFLHDYNYVEDPAYMSLFKLS